MPARIELVQNNTGPPLTISLINQDNDGPVDVSGATALKLFFMAQGSTTPLDTLTGTKLTGFLNEAGVLVAAGYTTPGSGGRMQFPWNPTTLQVTPGLYVGSLQITFADGTIQTAPDYIYFVVRPAP